MKFYLAVTAAAMLLFIHTHAQTVGKEGAVRNNTVSHAGDQKSVLYQSVSTGEYPARAETVTVREYYRAEDPVISRMNLTSGEISLHLVNTPRAGMPKHAYGFAHGKLMLHNRNATSSGTITGSGSVGTGSTLGSLGSRGPHMSINGKSPYSGSNMWGNAQGMILHNADANVRQAARETDD